MGGDVAGAPLTAASLPEQSLARGTLLNLIGQGIPLVVGTLTLPFIVRRMSPEAFGQLALFMAVLGYFGIFDLGLSRSATKLVAEALGRNDTETIPRIVRTTVVLHFILGVGFGGLLATIIPLIVDRFVTVPTALADDVRLSYYVLAAAVPIVVTTGAFRGILDAYRRFGLVNQVRIIAGSGNFMLPLIVLLLGGGLPAITLSLTMLRLISGLAYGRMCARLVGRGGETQALHRATVRTLFSFGGWVMASNILGPIITYLDRALIGTLVSVRAVGYYSPPYEMVSRLSVLPASLAVALFPAVSRLGLQNRETILALSERLVRVMLLVMTPVVVILSAFAEPILRLWLGPEFAREGTRTMQVLALGMLPNALAYIPFTVLHGLGRPDLTTKSQLAELLVYALGAWYLTRTGGISGAAVAWSLFLFLDALVLFILAGLALAAPLHLLRSAVSRLRPTLLSISAFSLFVALSTLLIAAPGARAALTGAAAAAFAWFAWSRVLEAEDRAAVFAAIKVRQ